MAGVFPVIPSAFSSRGHVLPLLICSFSFQGRKKRKGKKPNVQEGFAGQWLLLPIFWLELQFREQVQAAGRLMSSQSRSDRERKTLLKQKEGETGNAVSFIIRGKISNFGPRLSPALEQTSHVFCWWLRHITVLAGCPCWLTEGGLAVAE